MYSNVSSILPKLEELKAIIGNTKAAVISITESKIDNSVSNAEIVIPCYCMVGIYIGEQLHVMLGRIYVLI